MCGDTTQGSLGQHASNISSEAAKGLDVRRREASLRQVVLTAEGRRDGIGARGRGVWGGGAQGIRASLSWQWEKV